MTDVKISDRAVDNLRIVQFFDPDAAFNYGTSSELSLVSRDGYELVFKGDDFAFNSRDEPTDGTITDIYLYDPDGNLVGRIDGVNYSLEDYYDKVAVDGHSGAFTAELMAGADSITGGAADDYLEGYAGADSIAGGYGDDFISGGADADKLSGGSGFDDIYGGTGNDTVSGGSGDDLIYGGDGADRLTGDGGNDSIAGEAGNDVISGGLGNDKIEGGAGADRINGDGGNDVLGGGSSGDTIDGGAGNDRIYGDGGNDVLKGGTGADAIDGGAGNDTISGGADRDVLFGGAGDDQFHFDKLSDGYDIVQDFTRGADKLVFDASGFAGMTADFGLVVGEDPTATGSKGTFLFDTDSHKLFWDADGDGKGSATLVAVLDDVTNLSKDDFIIT